MGQRMCKSGSGADHRRDKRVDYSTVSKMSATIVEEFVFNVDFIGSALVGKDNSGLTSIQKPLKELYLDNVKKSGSSPRSQNRELKMRPEGVLMTFRDTTGQTRHAFYDLASIQYFESVRFTASRCSDKKIRGCFEPISPDAKLKANLSAICVDKKHAHLTEQQHPPMFTCVIRRHSSVKTLDCFVFIAASDNEALQMTSILARNKQDYRTGSAAPKRQESISSSYRAVDGSQDRRWSAVNTSPHGNSPYESRGDYFRPRSSDFDNDAVKDDGYLYPYPNNNDPSVANNEVTRRNRGKEGFSVDRSMIQNRPPSVEEYNARREDVPRPRFGVTDDSPTYRGIEDSLSRYGNRNIDEDEIPEYRQFPADHDQPKNPARDKNDDSFGPVCSMSNLESRQEMEKSNVLERTDSVGDSSKSRRPVAKVPPHLVAGVKVLPTEFKLNTRKQGPELSPRHEMSLSVSRQSEHSPPEYQDIRYHVIDDNKGRDEREETRDVRRDRPTTARDRQSWGPRNPSEKRYSSHDQEFAAYAARHEMVSNPYNAHVSDPHSFESPPEFTRTPLTSSYSANPTYSSQSWSVHDGQTPNRNHIENIGFSYLSMNESRRVQHSPQEITTRQSTHGGPRTAPRPTSKYGMGEILNSQSSSNATRGQSMEQSLGYLP